MWQQSAAPPPTRSIVASVVPPVVISGLLWWVGWRLPALAVLVGAAALVLLERFAPRVGRAVGHVAERAGHLVGVLLTTILLTAVHVLVFVPAAAVMWPLRRWRARRIGAPRSTWERRPPPVDARRTYSAEARPTRSPCLRRAGLVPVAVGAVALLVLVDLGLGWTYDEVLGTHDDPLPVWDASPQQWQAVLTTSPATADEPWIDDYVEELRSTQVRYVPYLEVATVDREGRHISVEDGRRVTWEPDGLPADAPQVWVLGGSTVWGEGHRDDHTLPSELARLAAAAGVPVRFTNLAERGSTTWQDMLRFERALAERTAPFAVVVYGGVNDVAAALGDPTIGPTSLAGGIPAAPVALSDDGLWADYRDHSLLAHALDGVRGVIGVAPAGAGEGEASTAATAATVGQRTADVLHHAELLIDALASAEGTQVVSFWQAAAQDLEPYGELIERHGSRIDLSDALDDRPDTWIDRWHANEAGTASVARDVWEQLEPMLAEAGSVPTTTAMSEQQP